MEIWSLLNPLLKFLGYLLIIGALGSALFYCHFSHYLSQPTKTYCVKLIHRSCLAGVIVYIILFAATAGNFGGDLTSVADPFMLQLAWESKTGQSVIATLIGFILISIGSVKPTGVRLVIGGLGGALLVLTFSIAGHASSHGPLTASLIVLHLAGVTYWLGALLPLRYMCLNADSIKNLHRVADRFGRYAVGYVGLSILAGGVIAYQLLGEVSALITSPYGNLLLFKLTLVALLLLFAAWNKIRLVPILLMDSENGALQLRKSINFEVLLGTIILLICSLLTTSVELPSS